MKFRSNLYKLTGQNDKETFVLAKSIQDATSVRNLPEGCGAEIIGLDSIKRVELVNDFEITELAMTRIIEDVIKSKTEQE